jgi:hypothetical protein
MGLECPTPSTGFIFPLGSFGKKLLTQLRLGFQAPQDEDYINIPRGRVILTRTVNSCFCSIAAFKENLSSCEKFGDA